MTWSYAALIKEMNALGPFRIETVNWDGVSLALSGKDWSLATTSPWRVSYDGRYVCGSDDLQLAETNNWLCQTINEFKLDLDLTLVFSTNMKLDVFCCTTSEAWIFNAKGMSATVVYVPDEDIKSCSVSQ